MTLEELNKTVFKGQAGKCAKETLKYLVKHWLEEDTLIYVNGYRISYHGRDWDKDTEKFDWNKIKVENANVHRYLDYAGDFMSMSFEGLLYDVMNDYYEGAYKREQELCDIFKKYGKYYELGNAWNLSLYNL